MGNVETAKPIVEEQWILYCPYNLLVVGTYPTEARASGVGASLMVGIAVPGFLSVELMETDTIEEWKTWKLLNK